MSRSAKELLKEIAAFGEKQFHETGAAAVEVLRVKASTIRKHFRKLRGIAYLVAVISLDRVRIYFFNTSGTLLIAENIELNLYVKIRKTSRLIIKFEKPRPPTEEELRIEATEELRTEFSKAIRKVSRLLGQKEPKFPSLFVSREKLNPDTQSFGLLLSEDGTMIFEENSIEANYAEGLNLRAAMLLLLEPNQAQLPFSQCLGNALAFSLLKEPVKTFWLKAWKSHTSEDLLRSAHIHFVKHASTYLEGGYVRLVTLLQDIPPLDQLEKWIDGLEIIHDSLMVPLGTEDYQIIKHFCGILDIPRKLSSTAFTIDSIHLAPRVICDPTPLGITLSMMEIDYSSNFNEWLSVNYLDGSERKSVILSEEDDNKISSIDYILNIDDLFPKPAGIMAHGKDFIRWATQRMGVATNTQLTFEMRIKFNDTDLAPDEKAVLERLSKSQPEIISNSLIGSPHRVDSLVQKGKIVFLPDFHHLGITPNYLIIGENDIIKTGVKEYSLESTIINSENAAYAIVCAPLYWSVKLMEYAFNEGLRIHPLVQVYSMRRIIRCENILPSDSELESWMTSD